MATISTLNSLVWIGLSSQECSSEQLVPYKNKIKFYYEVSQSGSGAKLGSPVLAEFFSGDILNIGCGTGGLLFSEQTEYNLSNSTSGDLGSNSGSIDLLYDESFDIRGLQGEQENANGTYKLTSFFKNNKPTFYNENGKWIWWNIDSWSLTNSPNNTEGELKNKDDNPKGGIWDCEPSCQQTGQGPESPELSCIPSTHEIFEYSDQTLIIQSSSGSPFATMSFNDQGSIGINTSEFPETQGLPRLLTMYDPDNFAIAEMTLQAWPKSNTTPTVYFDCTSDFCNGKCYSGNVTLIEGTVNYQANLTLQ